jgi:hypothetical protein
MNRKLQHSMLALSTTSAVFAVLLLAGGPTTTLSQASHQALSADDAVIGTPPLVADPAPGPGQRHHLRRSRALLALPYLSFAQGLRGHRS